MPMPRLPRLDGKADAVVDHVEHKPFSPSPKAHLDPRRIGMPAGIGHGLTGDS